MYHKTNVESPLASNVVPRALRFIFCGLEMRRWRLWATFALINPVAVRLNRFFAPLFVFILGIFNFRSLRHASAATGMPLDDAKNVQASHQREGEAYKPEQAGKASEALAEATGHCTQNSACTA
jgi:hypothetical protein